MVTLSECTFALLRRELAAELKVAEGDIEPSSPLERVIPPGRRPAVWRGSESRLGLALPALELSPAMARTGRLLSLGTGLRAGVVGLVLGAKWLAFPLAVAGLVAFAAFYRVLSSPWRTHLPGIETFGDLAGAVLARNMAACRDLFGLSPTRDEIYAAVVLILEEVGADPKRITPETPLVELLD